MTLPNVWRWDARLTALSSVMHAGESLGTVRYLRRERFLLPDGSVEDIPVLSGNMLRGILRRLAADLWWDAMGRPKMSMALGHAIWSGGALAKSTTDPLSTVRLQQVRAACPVVGLFGAAGGGRIVEGAVQVRKALPLCSELLFVTGVESPTSIWDMTQIEYLSKAPSMPRRAMADPQDASPMRYGVESFLAGSSFTWGCSVSWASDAELSLWRDTLEMFVQRGQVGGMSAAGFGDVAVEWLSTPSLPSLPDWRAALPSWSDAAAVLGRLD